MKKNFEIGAKKIFTKIVQANETAIFESGEVHPFYATFALGKDAEWVCRLFVLEMKESHEEGIGTFLNITHASPALVNHEVVFEAILEQINGNEVICCFTAKVGDRLVASGKTGQKILKKEKLERLLEKIS